MKLGVPMLRSRPAEGTEREAVQDQVRHVRVNEAAADEREVVAALHEAYGRSRLRSATRGTLNAMTLTMPMRSSRANEAGAELMGAQDATSRA